LIPIKTENDSVQKINSNVYSRYKKTKRIKTRRRGRRKRVTGERGVEVRAMASGAEAPP